MAANSINIKTGSERENFYNFSVILIDIGTVIAQQFVQYMIKLDGFSDLQAFIDKNKDQINKNHLETLRKKIKKPGYTLNDFDIIACASFIQNIVLPYYVKLPSISNLCDIELIKTTCKNLMKLRDLRNQHFAHRSSFTMQNREFKNLITKLDAVFQSLTGISGFIYDYRSEINKLMNEFDLEKKMRKHFESILENFIDNNKTQINDFLHKMSLKDNEDKKSFEDIKTSFNQIDVDSFMSSVEILSTLIKENNKTSSSIVSSELKPFAEQMQTQMIKFVEK